MQVFTLSLANTHQSRGVSRLRSDDGVNGIGAWRDIIAKADWHSLVVFFRCFLSGRTPLLGHIDLPSFSALKISYNKPMQQLLYQTLLTTA
ncbi:hypothetical protein SDJN02_19262, partial [Cucurbita argyrosperma subsp. argyrosperma]